MFVVKKAGSLKDNRLRANLSLLAMMAFTTIVFPLPLRAQIAGPIPDTRKAYPLNLSVALEKDRLLLGEPVVITYTVSDVESKQTSAAEPKYYLGFNQETAWLTLQLRDAKGKIVASTQLTRLEGAKSRFLQERTGGTISGFNFYSGGSYANRIVLGEKRLPVLKPGKFEVVVTATTLRPVRKGLSDDAGTRTVNGKVLGFPGIKPTQAIYRLDRKFVLPLVVTRNARQLSQRAEALRTDIVANSYHQNSEAIAVLYSLYGADASRSQFGVFIDLQKAEGSPDTVMNEIQYLETPEAADFLARQAWSMGNRGAKLALAKMRLFSYPELRAYIEEQFHKHKEKIPSIFMDLD